MVNSLDPRGYEAAARALREAEAKRKEENLGNDGGRNTGDIIELFNLGVDLHDMLAKCDYVTNLKGDYSSLAQQNVGSGNFSTKVFEHDDKQIWVSLSDTDKTLKGLGRESDDGNLTGDAFDLLAYYIYDGDQLEAVQHARLYILYGIREDSPHPELRDYTAAMTHAAKLARSAVDCNEAARLATEAAKLSRKQVVETNVKQGISDEFDKGLQEITEDEAASLDDDTAVALANWPFKYSKPNRFDELALTAPGFLGREIRRMLPTAKTGSAVPLLGGWLIAITAYAQGKMLLDRNIPTPPMITMYSVGGTGAGKSVLGSVLNRASAIAPPMSISAKGATSGAAIHDALVINKHLVIIDAEAAVGRSESKSDYNKASAYSMLIQGTSEYNEKIGEDLKAHSKDAKRRPDVYHATVSCCFDAQPELIFKTFDSADSHSGWLGRCLIAWAHSSSALNLAARPLTLSDEAIEFFTTLAAIQPTESPLEHQIQTPITQEARCKLFADQEAHDLLDKYTEDWLREVSKLPEGSPLRYLRIRESENIAKLAAIVAVAVWLGDNRALNKDDIIWCKKFVDMSLNSITKGLSLAQDAQEKENLTSAYDKAYAAAERKIANLLALPDLKATKRGAVFTGGKYPGGGKRVMFPVSAFRFSEAIRDKALRDRVIEELKSSDQCVLREVDQIAMSGQTKKFYEITRRVL